MSIKVMNLVWENAPYEGNTLLTLLALADRADDEGVCWPSVLTLATKTRQSERNVQRCLAKIAKDGFLYRSFRRDESTLYRIPLERYSKGAKLSPVDPGRQAGPEGVTGQVVPRPPVSPNTSNTTNTSGDVDVAIEMVYQQYPRKLGKPKGLQRIKEASKRIAKEKKITQIEALRRLFLATKLFAEKLEREARSEEMTPHPSSWYHGGYYDEFLDKEQKAKSKPISLVDVVRQQRKGVASA